jgi:threonine dehydrogenase-like Zn-dependent dehydrogenase
LLGWHIDGCFAQFAVVPQENCILLSESVSFQAGAYLEPVTAALGVLRAPLKKAERIAVLGSNQMAELISILLTQHAQCPHDRLKPSADTGAENSYDMVIETEATGASLELALGLLKPDGLLVLKSRPAGPVSWPVRLQVEKEITTMGVSYGSIRLATLLLKNKNSMFETLWLKPVPLEDWLEMFEKLRTGDNCCKTFFLPNGI